MKQYGITQFKSLSDEQERHLENIRFKGYTILKSILTESECTNLCEKSESIYDSQVQEFGLENLKIISELDIVRAPFYYDDIFLFTIKNEYILNILRLLFKSHFILHLQNVIINRPHNDHHQASWHRDIPYQEYTVSNPIAISVFYCLSPFNDQTGATKILPYSHLISHFPSIEFAEDNAVLIEANPGDVVIFDSWIYHRATRNISNIVRYGVNHVFTVPILKQQIDFPKLLKGKYYDDLILRDLLGYSYQVATSVNDFRKRRLEKYLNIQTYEK